MGVRPLHEDLTEGGHDSSNKRNQYPYERNLQQIGSAVLSVGVGTRTKVIGRRRCVVRDCLTGIDRGWAVGPVERGFQTGTGLEVNDGVIGIDNWCGR